MCEPITLTAMAVTAGMGMLQAYGQSQEGKAQNNYYQSLAKQNEAQIDAQNKVADKQITMVQDQGLRDTRTQDEKAKAFQSSQKASMAANGVFSDAVTSSDVMTDTFDKAKLDQLAIRQNADMKSWEVDTDRRYKNWDQTNQANMNRWAGKSAKVAGNNAAKMTLLKTAVSVASMGFGVGAGAEKGFAKAPMAGRGTPGSGFNPTSARLIK